MSAQPDLSIIIINWKSVAFLRKCLRSINANTRTIRFEVIVVDNASGDNCQEMIAREFPSVRYVQSDCNLGFARANNLGFQHSSGRNLLFLNPDTEVIASAIEGLAHILEKKPRAGIVGPKLLNSDGSVQTSCIRSFPSLISEVLDAELLHQRFPHSRLWGTRALFARENTPVAVDAVSGACLMIRRQVFEQIGLFTTSYFMYAEDVDLCLKARQAGWINLFVPNATVTHHGGQSSRSQDDGHFADIVLRESRLRFFRNRRGALYAASYRVATMTVALVRLGMLATWWTFAGPERGSAALSIRKWLRILRWALGMESWAERLGQSSAQLGATQSGATTIGTLTNSYRHMQIKN
jgi:GT2 family glycosyltransferase